LDSIELAGKKDLLANHLIDLYEYHTLWEDANRENLLGFKFTSDDEPNFPRTDNLVMGTLYSKVVGNRREGIDGLVSVSYQEDTGILNVTSNTLSEELSYELCRRIYGELSEFYVEKSTEKQRASLKRLEIVADSVSRELRKVEYQIASFEDRSLGIRSRQERVKGDRLQRDAQVLSIMYGEAIKNKEAARFALQSAMPFFQPIDLPQYPLIKRQKNYLREGIVGGAFGVFLAFLFLGLRKMYLDVMAK
jgi:hypothetical protein